MCLPQGTVEKQQVALSGLTGIQSHGSQWREVWSLAEEADCSSGVEQKAVQQAGRTQQMYSPPGIHREEGWGRTAVHAWGQAHQGGQYVSLLWMDSSLGQILKLSGVD